MKEMPDMSIVVLNWNTSDLLAGALESVVRTADHLVFDVTVIDNASTDGGFARLGGKFTDDPRFRFVQNEKNVGWAAINRMLAETRGKYIVTVDPDAIVHPGALQSLVAFMEAYPEAGAATAGLLNPDGSPQLYYRRIMTPRWLFFTTVLGRAVDKLLFDLRNFRSYRYADVDTSRVSEIEQPAWPCLIWRREALGPYIVDEKIPFYFVDVDMSKRVYDRKYKIYMVPDAVTTHLKSTSFSKTANAWRKQEYRRSLFYYFRKHYPLWSPFIWVGVWADDGMRMILRSVFGREPLR